ncbi:hypothetical protein [Nitrospina gracilis]|uniref:hypothetical protein n=1 Tax=Nitrospina gracilis TaxID=35801 RepID=UPI001F2EAAFC|nr:hypothetical protein [Nitrospina gracilis]MCF8719226.1 hypothetical protein [Nitrospina gracilis Nb-211]
MTISDEALRLLNPWLIAAVGVLFTIVGWLVVRLLKSIEKRIAELSDRNREDFAKLEGKIDQDFTKLEKKIEDYREESEIRAADLEKQFWEFRSRLPEKFVMRDDWIRNASTLELKIDRILTVIKTERGNDELNPTQQN